MDTENKICVFIDASNLWQAQKAKGKFLDYKKTIIFLKKKFQSNELKIFYYTAYPAQGTREYGLDSKHKFYTYLKKGLGIIVRKKELKRIHTITAEGESIQEKGNMDVEISIDVMYHIQEYDTAIFFTGDSDFLALTAHLRSAGKKVFVFSSKNNISQELRTSTDGYFDILRVEEDIWGRNLKYREKRV